MKPLVKHCRHTICPFLERSWGSDHLAKHVLILVALEVVWIVVGKMLVPPIIVSFHNDRMMTGQPILPIETCLSWWHQASVHFFRAYRQ